MKNPRHPSLLQPGHLLRVSVSIDEEVLLQDLVEKLAHCPGNYIPEENSLPEGWQAVETSSIEAFVSGNLEIMHRGQLQVLSYTTCFAYTCTRIPGEKNTLRWANSLS